MCIRDSFKDVASHTPSFSIFPLDFSCFPEPLLESIFGAQNADLYSNFLLKFWYHVAKLEIPIWWGPAGGKRVLARVGWLNARFLILAPLEKFNQIAEKCPRGVSLNFFPMLGQFLAPMAIFPFNQPTGGPLRAVCFPRVPKQVS